MKRILLLIPSIIVTALIIFSPIAIAQEIENATGSERIVIESADYLKNERETGITTLKGGVSFKYNDSTVSADEAVLDEKTKTAVAKSNVTIVDSMGTFSGSMLFYDYDKEWFEISNGSGSTASSGVEGQVYFSGGLIKGTSNKIKLYKAVFTTCAPSCKTEYKMIAKEATIYPGNKVIARHVYFYAGGTRVLYFPVFMASLKEQRRYTPEFGYDKNKGFYVKTNYPYLAKEFLAGWVLLEYMSKKGIRYGAEHKYTSKKLGGEGSNKFETNRESDTGYSSNYAEIKQVLKIGDRISGNFGLTRNSTYNQYITSSRYNTNNITFNLTKNVYELQPSENGVRQGSQRRTIGLTSTFTSNQSTSGRQKTENITLNSTRTDFNQKVRTNFSYQLTGSQYASKANNLTGNFKFDSSYSTGPVSIALSLQRAYDLDHDKYTSDNSESVNVLWPKLTLTPQQKYYSKLLPQKFIPITSLYFTTERIRQGARNNSEALRRNTFYSEARKSIFQNVKNLTFNITQSFTQYYYSTKDAQYIMKHTSDMNYRFTERTNLNLTFNSTKDSGGSPYTYTSQREAIRMNGSFNVTSPGGKTKFSMSTQYNYRLLPGQRYSPLSFTYSREMTQNARVTIGGSRDINNSLWGDTNTSFDIQRKNTSLQIGALWNTEDLDLRTANITTILKRKNGWEFNISSIFEHRSSYGLIRQVAVRKVRCCTEIDMSYTESTKLFQFQYIIKAFPTKKFGFTQGNQGFELDQSIFNTSTQ